MEGSELRGVPRRKWKSESAEIPTLRPWYNYQQQQGDKEGRVEEGRDLRGSGAKKEGGRVEMTVRLNEVRHSSYFVSCDARRLGYIYSSNGTTHSDPNEIKWLRGCENIDVTTLGKFSLPIVSIGLLKIGRFSNASYVGYETIVKIVWVLTAEILLSCRSLRSSCAFINEKGRKDAVGTLSEHCCVGQETMEQTMVRLSFWAEPQQKQVKYGRRLERADRRVIETYTKAEYKRNRGTVNKAGVRESHRFHGRAKYRYLRGGGSAVCALVFVSFRQSGIRALEALVHRSRKTSWTGTSTATLKASRLPLSVRITMSDLFGRLNSGAAGNNVGRAGNMEIAEHR
uniref:Uncharacterized protein n=1 Tax=Vespula pensylvanica TaxID=30213 RepID=A0A834P369_VESPE|nr:hypothetical protein H0235_006546 [Vespula pensylvanica]